MEVEEGEWGEVGATALGLNSAPAVVRAPRIKKRALRNKALSVRFDEKDLKDFVTGFHKRKKKRRKIAQRQLQEKERLHRIEARRKRKLEREFALYGGALPAEGPPGTASGDEDNRDGLEHDSPNNVGSVSGTKMYENEGMKITVTTSELSRGEDDGDGSNVKHNFPRSSTETDRNRHLLPKKKPLKKAADRRSHKRKIKKPFQKKGGKKIRKR